MLVVTVSRGLRQIAPLTDWSPQLLLGKSLLLSQSLTLNLITDWREALITEEKTTPTGSLLVGSIAWFAREAPQAIGDL